MSTIVPLEFAPGKLHKNQFLKASGRDGGHVGSPSGAVGSYGNFIKNGLFQIPVEILMRPQCKEGQGEDFCPVGIGQKRELLVHAELADTDAFRGTFFRLSRVGIFRHNADGAIEIRFLILVELLDCPCKGWSLQDDHGGLSTKLVGTEIAARGLMYAEQYFLEEGIGQVRVFLGKPTNAAPVLDLLGNRAAVDLSITSRLVNELF